VDGKSLQGYSNHQAVEVLKNTGQMVRLKLVRFRHGPKYDKLQEYLAQANQSVVASPPPTDKETTAVSNPTYDLNSKHLDLEDNQIFVDDYGGALSPDVEAAIKAAWEPIVGNDFLVVVAQLSKFKEGGGLGISLEGTVDVEDGVEVRPHHYIRSILPDGPVGLNGRLKSSDELLEVNGRRLLGLNHVSVVEILKDLPQHVRLVCARRKSTQAEMQMHMAMPDLPKVEPEPFLTERLVKAKSEMSLSVSEPPAANLNKSKSRSLEPLTGLAMWSPQPVVIELEKADRGLGFSILDYQDPVNPNDTVIVIRSLVPGGVAQMDGRLVPGDRLIFVNNVNVEHATLDEAVQALKGAARGIVKIGVAKPLPLKDTFRMESQQSRLEESVLPPFTPAAADKETSAFALHNEALTAHEFETGHLEEPLSDVSDSSIIFDKLKVEIPSEEAAVSLDYKSLDSDQSAFSLEHSFIQSDSSGDTKQDMRRKDSFYESDDDGKTKKASSGKALTKIVNIDMDQPPAYESAVSQSESVVVSDRPLRAAAIVKPPRAGKPKRDLNTANSSLPSETGFSVFVMGKPVASEQHQFMEPVTKDTNCPDTHAALESTSAAQLSSNGETLAETVAAEVSSDEEVPAPPLRGQSTEVSGHNLTADPSQLDLSASLDSAEINSYQMIRGWPDTSEAAVPPLEPPRRGPPPIPPKPKDARTSLLVLAHAKEAPPALPVTSPPPASSPLASPVTPPLRPPPSSPKWGDGEFKLHGKQAIIHRKTSSSSSEHMTSSDLKTPPTSPLSRGHSTLTSPVCSPSLERTIHIQKANLHLGLSLEAVDKASRGCIVKSIAKPSAVEQDGRIQPGDYIVSLNSESLKRITNAQARAILRRSSLQGSDV
ncbi:unnamed protein product, partial [Candidula unifasciata]